TADKLNDLDDNPIHIRTDKGTLTLEGYDPATGKVSYSYEADGAQDHSRGKIEDEIDITVNDKLGGKAEGTLDVVITNTTPEAQPVTRDVELGVAGTNIMLILDTSGSMGFDSGVKKPGWGNGNYTRLEVLKS